MITDVPTKITILIAGAAATTLATSLGGPVAGLPTLAALGALLTLLTRTRHRTPARPTDPTNRLLLIWATTITTAAGALVWTILFSTTLACILTTLAVVLLYAAAGCYTHRLLHRQDRDRLLAQLDAAVHQQATTDWRYQLVLGTLAPDVRAAIQQATGHTDQTTPDDATCRCHHHDHHPEEQHR